MRKRCEVLIIGAGPAGLAAGIRLAELGHDVIVLERAAKPNAGKLCAGYVPMSLLRRLALGSGFVRFWVRGITFRDAEGGEYAVDFGEVVGANVDRAALAELLAARLRRLGAELELSCEARDLRIEGQRVLAETPEEVIEARAAILATGVHSRLPIRVGFPMFGPEDLGLCLQATILCEDASAVFRDHNIICFGRRFAPYGYAWIFPRPPMAAAGFGTLIAALDGDPRKYLERVVALLPQGRILSVGRALCPLSGPRPAIFRGPVAAVGDAGGFVSPLTGEGIEYAYCSGEAAAEALHQYLLGRLPIAALNKAFKLKAASTILVLRLHKLVLGLLRRGRAPSSVRMLDDPVLREQIARLYAGLKIRPLLRAALRIVRARLISPGGR